MLLENLSSFFTLQPKRDEEEGEFPPGSVVAGLKVAAAGFRGERGLKAGPVAEGSSGTVGKPGGEWKWAGHKSRETAHNIFSCICVNLCV